MTMQTIRLFVRRCFKEECFDFETIREAAEEAIGQMNHDLSYPDRIEVNGEVIWAQPGPSKVQESLERLIAY